MHAMTTPTPVIQVRPSGRRVLSKSSFWRITRDGLTVGFASGYQAALAKAAEEERRALACL